MAELGTQVKRRFYAAILAASDKTDCLYSKSSRARLHTTTAQNTVTVPERIANLFYPAAYGNVLDSTGIRRLCNEQLCNVATQFSDFFRMAQNYHTFLHKQCAGCGDF